MFCYLGLLQYPYGYIRCGFEKVVVTVGLEPTTSAMSCDCLTCKSLIRLFILSNRLIFPEYSPTDLYSKKKFLSSFKPKFAFF